MTNTAECIISHPIFAEAIANMRAEAERGVIPLAELLDSAARERMVGAVVRAVMPGLPALPRPPLPTRAQLTALIHAELAASRARLGSRLPYGPSVEPSLMERAWRKMRAQSLMDAVTLIYPPPPPQAKP